MLASDAFEVFFFLRLVLKTSNPNSVIFILHRWRASLLQDGAGAQPAPPGAQQAGADVYGRGELAAGVQMDPQQHGADALLAGVQVRTRWVTLMKRERRCITEWVIGPIIGWEVSFKGKTPSTYLVKIKPFWHLRLNMKISWKTKPWKSKPRLISPSRRGGMLFILWGSN